MAVTDSLYAQEYSSFCRSPGWELKNIQQALTSFPWLNSPAQTARLAAVKAILAERRSR